MPPSPTVLIVDDDGDIRDALCLVLEHNGYRALAASNGEEALSRLRSDGAVDLILLDMMMPVMDGWGFRLSQPEGPAFVRDPRDRPHGGRARLVQGRGHRGGGVPEEAARPRGPAGDRRPPLRSGLKVRRSRRKS